MATTLLPRRAARRAAAARPDRSARSHAHTRADILDAAARAFVRDGLRESTMQSIARECGFTAPALYKYFRCKDEIFAALRATMTDDFLASFDAPIPAGLSFAQSLELLVMRQLERIEARREAYAFLFAQRTHADSFPQRPGAQPRDPGMLRVLDGYGTWLRRHAPAELLVRLDPDALAFVLTGLGEGLFMMWLRDGRGDGLAAGAPQLVQLFLYGVLGVPPDREEAPHA